MIEQVHPHPRSLMYYVYAKSHETGFGWVLLGSQETALTNGELPFQEEPLWESPQANACLEGLRKTAMGMATNVSLSAKVLSDGYVPKDPNFTLK